jgi:adenylate kinase family enzyme
MKIYRSQTAPLIDYYSAQGKLQNFAVKKGLDDTPRLMRELGIPSAEEEGAAKKAA